MFRSLRSRLVLSHALPLLVIIPIIGVALTNLIETRVLLPSLSRALMTNAVLLANVAGDEAELWANPAYAEYYLTHLRHDISARVEFISPAGQLLASSDPEEARLIGIVLDFAGVAQARAGQVASYTYYNISSPSEVIDVFVPVLNQSQQLIGILRMSYTYNTLYAEFTRSRYVIVGILAGGLLVGIILGWSLAVNLSKPIRQVTKAINELAHGNRQVQVEERGPEEIQLLAESFNFLNERLTSLEKARRQLLANLVHELGRPLGALRSAIQALAGGADRDPQLLADLTAGMDDQTARLQHLLDDLAHLHDQVLGTLELESQPIALSEWLPKVIRPWQEAAQDKHLTWQTDIPMDLPEISADPVRLASAVENLVSNAIKYTHAGGMVSISAGVEGEEILIRVKDNGSGIALEEQQKVFEPFYRGNQGRRFKQGMGLGLSIARDLVAAHGGRISLESEPGKGSQFIIHLPLVRTEPTNTPSN
ncbi:MAG: HAMP domain-containing sensor histidine kinase [Anaerolineales bacterium]|jgi:signal transduction histidine kinase